MAFGDLKSDAGVSKLNDYLEQRSYVEGYQPSQADVSTYGALSGAPSAAKFPHAARWRLPSRPTTMTTSTCSARTTRLTRRPRRRARRGSRHTLRRSPKKPGVVAKSSVVLDVKPWDDETDMKELERLVRTVTCDGHMWGTSKLVPLAYGIHKLQIVCVVEDEKVSIDWLIEEIENFKDHVQSVDIAAFQKI
ncbi:hypothetical protein MTO96_018243 [Rhipicephalus appendiculatus]